MHNDVAASSLFAAIAFPFFCIMSIVAFEDKESPNVTCERVVRLRPAWVRYNYIHRGGDLRNLSMMEYIGSFRVTSQSPNADPPLTNFRYYLNTMEYMEIFCSDNEAIEEAGREMQEMPATADPNRWCL